VLQKPGERVRGIEGSEAEVVLTRAETARRQGMGNGKTLDVFMAGTVLHGSKARARASEMEGERGEEELGRPLLRRLGRRDAQQQPSAMVGARPMHGCHRDNFANTWCASLCLCWRPRSGWLWTESRNGPKSKVVSLLMLYIFH
jgi:hypothetical protein